MQTTFAEFVNAILPSEPHVAAVDGKAAKQMKDEDGDPIRLGRGLDGTDEYCGIAEAIAALRRAYVTGGPRKTLADPTTVAERLEFQT